jgi:hypothetical protein
LKNVSPDLKAENSVLVLKDPKDEPVTFRNGQHVKQPVLPGETTVTMQEPLGNITAYYVSFRQKTGYLLSLFLAKRIYQARCEVLKPVKEPNFT